MSVLVESSLVLRRLQRSDAQMLLVSSDVECEVIGSGKGTLTSVALEWFESGVFPIVASQFVGSCEPPLTSDPGAREWLLTCMHFITRLLVSPT